ncbi:uncharacterized protein TNCV_5095441 [Trichonephila clavipes]|nr:uncharacterized protein TNCV_5095441 [Trichonephila clavipes]
MSPSTHSGVVSSPCTSLRLFTIVTQKTKSIGKPWETQATVSPIPRYLERAEAVARFHLTTEHDFLRVYFHWLDLAANNACPICGHTQMDGDHLLQCNRLDEYLTTTSSVGTGRLGVKWSRSQVRALDK